MDESWVYQYDPETKPMSMECTHVDSPPPKIAKVQKSQGRVILYILELSWCHFHRLPSKGQFITGTYYSNLLDKLRVAVKNKRLAIVSRGICLLADNVPAHTSQVAVGKDKACSYSIL